MKIYYSRTVDTNDGINGSALQKFLERSGLLGKAELIRYEKQPVYSFEKLDSADMMIIGYCEDRHNDNDYSIGKGVYSEIERAYHKKIPIFLLNLNNPNIPYLEQINFRADLCIRDRNDYTDYAEIGLYYRLQELGGIPDRLCAYEHFSTPQIQYYLGKFNVDLSSLASKSSSQESTVKYDPVTFEQIETSPSLLLLRRK